MTKGNLEGLGGEGGGCKFREKRLSLGEDSADIS